MAKAVGKPLHVVMVTISKSRPSFVTVKVEFDLLKEFLKRINVGVKKTYFGEIISTWIKFLYDYTPNVRFKAECKVGFLSDRHILIRLTTMRKLLLPLRGSLFHPYHLIFFIKESLFTMVKEVGKLLHVDMATIRKSRPSYVKVKVEVDLLKEFPKWINVGVKKTSSGEIISTWIKILYDYNIANIADLKTEA
ncbi:hypothetical protein H5410_021966 [Solanum commersonii]|uniref:Uncharacterized protein n=1 Tax=Solanum commersonii TaxID=4109 RepID=A0A9J5ZE16_SOLCO|nr:hypothetical protein H5410_021966 [Solanum commersonii]